MRFYLIAEPTYWLSLFTYPALHPLLGVVQARNVFHLVFYQPCIPPNTGSAIRLAANTGSWLHLIEPLGFDIDTAKVRRAGLDYHEIAKVKVHPSLNVFFDTIQPNHTYAFTTHTQLWFSTIEYHKNDALLFGPEPSGLPAHVLNDPRVTSCVRIPMVEKSRSLNLANSASIALYEAWRQHGFLGAK